MTWLGARLRSFNLLFFFITRYVDTYIGLATVVPLIDVLIHFFCAATFVTAFLVKGEIEQTIMAIWFVHVLGQIGEVAAREAPFVS